MGNTFARHLRARGYNALALPTARFAPLALVFEHKGSRGWSTDFGYLVRNATDAPPIPDQPTPEPDLSGKEVRDLDVSGTLDILGGLISALGGGKLGLKGGFEQASSIIFRYGKVTMAGVSEAALDRYIQSGTADRSTIPGRYLGDHLHVATRVLRSRSFEVSAQDSSGRSIGLDLPVIAGAVGAAVSVKRSTTSETAIAFDGDLDVTFAFEAFRILEKDGRMRIFPAKAGTVSTASVTKASDARDSVEARGGTEPAMIGNGDQPVTFDSSETVEP